MPVLAALLWLAAPSSAHLPVNAPPAGVILTQADALKQAFGDDAKRRTLFLTPEQSERAAALAGGRLNTGIVPVYSSGSPSSPVAFFERASAGQASVTVMTLVAGDGTIASVSLLASDLPKDFLPPAGWLDSLRGLALDRLTWNSRGLRRHHEALAAAEAVHGACRRALAVFEAALRER